MKKEKCLAIVLAAGSGRRMQTEIPKQYLLLQGIPMLVHSLLAFEESDVEDICLVVSEGEEERGRELGRKYGIKKLKYCIAGGKERYLSVYKALCACTAEEYTFAAIHDSARPMIKPEYIHATIADAGKYGSGILAVALKDTIKTADQDGFVRATLERSSLFAVQTPQSFYLAELKAAYELLMQDEQAQIGITDDAMVMERMLGKRIKLTEGFYENIKVTTPEDIQIAQLWLS